MAFAPSKARVAIGRTAAVGIVVVLVVAVGASAYYYNYANSTNQKILTVYSVGLLKANTDMLNYYKNYSHLSSDSLYVGSSGDVVQKALSEISAQKYIADIVIDQPFQMDQLYRAGDLLNYTPSCASTIMSNPLLKQFTRAGYYYPMKGSILGIAVNTNYINASTITSYASLASPSFAAKWAGRVGMEDVRTGITADLYYFMNATYGSGFWKNLSGLSPLVLYSKGSIGMDDLTSGKLAVLIGSLAYQIADARASGDNYVQFIYPKEGVIFSPALVGILKTAPDMAQAKAFESWLCSPAGQQEIVSSGVGLAAYGPTMSGVLSTEQLISGHLTVPENETAYENTPISVIASQWEQVFHISG